MKVGGLLLLLCSAVGTAAATPVSAGAQADCDSNYTGACVPIADDVDCEGGDGDGPEYVTGPVTVVGEDIYNLDHDGNGTGCEGDGTPTTTTTTAPTATTVPAPPVAPAQPIVGIPDTAG